MSAETHLEVYRPFTGELREHRMRFWPLTASGLRTALKQRKALLILYAPAAITTVILCFVVYFSFSAKEMVQGPMGEELGPQGQLAAQMAVEQASQVLGVVSLILNFSKGLGLFSLLAVAWFASGLVCDDRKAGAHQLYFARPLTRLDYFLGKFTIAAFFASLAVLVPLFVVCIAAVFCSPEWSFLEQEWDVILRSIAFGLLWTVVVSSLVLAASSLASRKSFALLGVFAVTFLAVPVAEILGQVADERFYALALLDDLNTLAHHVFGRAEEVSRSPRHAWAAVIALVLACWGVIAWRLRRLEVVA
jgi:ABC-type transport system involved in multi-copper enzyme maturation permease subunit